MKNFEEEPKSRHNKKKYQFTCDDCKEVFLRRWSYRCISYEKHKKDVCSKCSSKKRGEAQKGVPRPKHVIDKAIETKKKNARPLLTIECKCCGKEFKVKYAERDRIYCSRSCQVKSIPKTDIRKTSLCRVCGSAFKHYGERIVCSRKCLSEYFSEMRLGENNPNWQKPCDLEEAQCRRCNKVFKYNRSGLHKGQKRVFCSQKCSHKNGNNKEISNTINYERSKNRYPKEFNDQLKEAIKKRDGYICQMCNSQNDLCVHHIDYEKHNCDESNLITLCEKCHNMTHHNRGFWSQLFIGLSSNSKIVKKGWGLEIHFVNHSEYCLKYLVFFKNKKFSWHWHPIKKELWLCSWGRLKCFLKSGDYEDVFYINPGDKIEIEPGVEHQLTAVKNSIITEVSTRDFPEDSIRIKKGD